MFKFLKSKPIVQFSLFMLSLSAAQSVMSQDAAAQAVNKEYSVKIGSVRTSPGCDTLYADFKILKSGKKVFNPALLNDPAQLFRVTEKGVAEKYCPQIERIVDLRQGSHKSLSDNLSILLLIDRSATISDDLLTKQFEVVKSFVNALPDTKIYVSFMDEGVVTQAVKVDAESFENSLRPEFYTGDLRDHRGEKHLYRAILSKLQELSGEDQTEDTYPSVESNGVFKNTPDQEKMLFVFTDGEVVNPRTGLHYGGDENYYNCLLKYTEREEEILNGKLQNIPVHCVYVGTQKPDETLESALTALCSSGKEDDVKGKFYQNITPDSLQSMMMGTLDSLASDYRLVMVNPEGKLYDGSKIMLGIEVLYEGALAGASGEREYAAGNMQSPVVVSHSGSSVWDRILKGLLFGLLLWVVVYAIMQYLVPRIRYSIFKKKYVKPYSATGTDVEHQSCYFCKEEFHEGDTVVAKCEHIVHLECWEENHNRCPEYGMHKCKKGIHYYNREKLSDPRNATHYLPWILYGFAAGLISWIFYTMLQSADLFAGLVSSLTDALYPFGELKSDEDAVEAVKSAMTAKTHGLLLCGILLGFFIVLAFSLVLEFRKKDAKVVLHHLLRALVGAVAGWVAFLLGVLVIILCGKQYSCWWIDWVPWLFFSLVTAIVLWYKTEIKLRSALLGGAASVLFSFIVLYVLTGPITSMFSYMIYAAGLGISIAVVHFASEKYFLRLDGSIKERDIAIYKWMSVTGGFNKVSIGKSVNCVLQMNWDDSTGIGDRVVELYLKNDRPYCKVLDGGVTQQGRTIPQGVEFVLVNGTEFTIGKTNFTYIEKDR